VKISREPLKELLKSLRRGRLHRLLRLTLFSLFLFFSVLVVRDITVFYLKEKKISHVEYSGISISLSKGEITLRIEELLISRPNFKLHLNGARTSLDLWKSIRELHPHFSEIKVGSLQLERAGKEERKFLPVVAVKLPFYVERLSLGELLYRSGKTTLHLKDLKVDEERAFLRGIEGKSGNVEFKVYEICEGSVEANTNIIRTSTYSTLVWNVKIEADEEIELEYRLKGRIVNKKPIVEGFDEDTVCGAEIGSFTI
jgi:hypothetical protein